MAIKTYENILDFNNTNDVVNQIIKIEEKLNYIKKFLKYSWNIQNINTNSLELNIKIKNTGTIVVKKIYVRLKILNKKNQPKTKISKIDQSLSYNEEELFKLNFNNIESNYNKIECLIVGIDWK